MCRVSTSLFQALRYWEGARVWGRRESERRLGFGRLCSKKKNIMLLAVLIFFRNYAKIMLLSENYALCHRNYAT